MILVAFVFDWVYIVYPVILFILFIGLRYLLHKMRKKTDLELQRLLFRVKNLFLYEELLNNPRLKLLFTKTELAFLRLNGYMVLGTNEQIVNQFLFLDHLSLRPKMALDLYHKQMTYYIDSVQYEQALVSYKKLRDILLKEKHEQAKKILEEADLIIKIYIHHDTTVMDVLKIKLEQTKNTLMQGVIYYRLAKLSYYQKRYHDAEDYLKKAEPLLKHSTYEAIIKMAFKDIHILKTK